LSFTWEIVVISATGRILIVLACGLAALALFGLSAGGVEAAGSQLMPLADKSLLLDGQAVAERLIAVGERGHILISEDNGLSWQQQPVPTRSTLTSVYFVDSANGWAAGHDSVILRTRDGGASWQQVYADPQDERPILDLWFRDARHGYAVGGYGLILATSDGGASWQPLDFDPATLLTNSDSDDPWSAEAEDAWVDFHLNQIAVSRNGRVFIAAEAGNLYRSDDGCRSWLSLPTPYEGSFYGVLPLAGDSLLAFGLRGHLFRSDDGGVNWRELATASRATIDDGIILSDGRLLLAGLAGTLLLSADGGQSFTRLANDKRDGIAKVLQSADGSVILLGEHGARRLRLPPRTGGQR
jgi:photosystem II stability/assembly factor-like uncharacterized protein